MMRQLVAAVGIAGLLVLPPTAGEAQRAEPEAGLGHELASRARTILVEWLECEECTDRELERVVALGQAIVPSLAAVLEKGPAPAKAELTRRSLRASYRRLADYAERHPDFKLPMGEEEYVLTYLDNFRAVYRIRAAKALAAIGTEAAWEALRTAAGADFRADVMATIDDLLGDRQTKAALAERARRTIVEWLECEECTDQKLERVVGLGSFVVPTLAAVLEQGPAPARLELFRRNLRDSHRRLAAYAERRDGKAVPLEEADYVATYLENFVAIYRIRAAEALAVIGGKRAHSALQAAARAGYREDVTTAVKDLVDTLPE